MWAALLALQEAREVQQFTLRNVFRQEFKDLFPGDFQGITVQKLIEEPEKSEIEDLFEAGTFQAWRALSRTRNLQQLLEESIQKGRLTAEDVQTILEEKLEDLEQRLPEVELSLPDENDEPWQDDDLMLDEPLSTTPKKRSNLVLYSLIATVVILLIVLAVYLMFPNLFSF